MRRASAFTLVEVVLAMGVLGVVLVGAMGALFLSARSIAAAIGESGSAESRDAVLGEISRNLSQARSIVRAESTAVEFTVADRNKDGSDDTITYAWDGRPGSPLMASINGGKPSPLADTVNDFSIEYTTRDESVWMTGTPVECAETTLFISQAGAASPKNWGVTTTKWIGQMIRPWLPPDATAWKITRVRFVARTNGSTADTSLLQIRTTGSAEAPSATVLEQVSIPEVGLSSLYAWRTASFSTLSNLSPRTTLCVVVANTAAGTSADIRYAEGGVYVAGGHLETTTDRAASWTTYGDRAMDVEVLGTYTRATSPVEVTRTRLVGASFALTLQDLPGSAVAETAIENMPEVTP